MAINRAGAHYFINPDHLNSARSIGYANGQNVWTRTPSPFGEDAPNQNPNGFGTFTYNPGPFPGQYRDSETGLAYNMLRDYAPKIGRYVQSDPIGLAGGSFSTYGYVGGNPTNAIDPSGLSKYDPFYGLPKAFWNWLHRAENGKLIESLKNECGHVSKEDARELYQEWLKKFKNSDGFIDVGALISLALPPFIDALMPSPTGGCEGGICSDSVNQSYPAVPLPKQTKTSAPLQSYLPNAPLQSYPSSNANF